VRALRCQESAGQSTEDVASGGTEPSEIIVCFTRGGELAHALHFGKTVPGPWVKFASADTLEEARYLGATEEQVDAHRHTMRQTGQGSSHVRLLPNRKNLLRIDWNKL
jgi:hypothetical protein